MNIARLLVLIILPTSLLFAGCSDPAAVIEDAVVMKERITTQIEEIQTGIDNVVTGVQEARDTLIEKKNQLEAAINDIQAAMDSIDTLLGTVEELGVTSESEADDPLAAVGESETAETETAEEVGDDLAAQKAELEALLLEVQGKLNEMEESQPAE